MPRKVVVSVVALALAGSACSLGTKPSISVKAVPVDLAFGGNKPTPTPAAAPARPVFPVAQPTFVFAPPATLPPLPENLPGTRSACEPLSPFPQEPAPPSVEDRPTLGGYRFSYERTVGKKTTNSDGFRTLEDLTILTRGPDNIGFTYLMRDGFTRVAIRLRVETADPTRGLYVTEIGFPEGEREVTITFRVPLQVVAFPMEPGAELSARAIDPLSGSIVSSETTLLPRDPGKDRIKACDEVVDAWRLSWTLTVQGVNDQSWEGTFWLATQWGGWPIADQVSFTGDFVDAAVSSRILEVQPARKVQE